ncbi:MAG: hypothetical protein D6815_11095 [Candidatus Dadabacteria bacterium]|nr:MAG: hypothetical protein D6815_11095 [Candidatus Dadabacteria bacterium]
MGPQLPDPVLASVWLQCMQNAVARKDAVVRAIGFEWQDKDPVAIGLELFRRVLAHPEGTEIARAEVSRNLEENIGWPDGKVRLAPEPLIAELRRCIETPPARSQEYPFVLASGLRTRWTANTIHRDPSWRAGAAGRCTLHISPEDARRLGIDSGDLVRLRTARGSAELPAEIDGNVLAGHVWVPNGYGMVLGDPTTGEQCGTVGVNLNALADAQDRDPLTGIPHHKATPCNVEPVRQTRTSKRGSGHAVHASA